MSGSTHVPLSHTARAGTRTLTSMHAGPGGGRQFGAHKWAAEIERRFGLHERRSFPFQYPDMRVGRLLAEHGREQSGHSANVGLEDVVCGSAWRTTDRKRAWVAGGEVQFYQPWFLRRCDKRDAPRQGVPSDLLQHRDTPN